MNVRRESSMNHRYSAKLRARNDQFKVLVSYDKWPFLRWGYHSNDGRPLGRSSTVKEELRMTKDEQDKRMNHDRLFRICKISFLARLAGGILQ